jgi:hypothetical protein
MEIDINNCSTWTGNWSQLCPTCKVGENKIQLLFSLLCSPFFSYSVCIVHAEISQFWKQNISASLDTYHIFL